MAGRVLKVLEDQGLLRATGKTIVVFGARPKMKTKPPLAAAASRVAPQSRRGEDDDEDDDFDDDED
jgi:CRP/FNR family cyclic AMP-dependent transcriptional regulator